MDRRRLDHDELAADVPAYLLGALDAGNCDAVAEHIEECPACKAEARRINETVGVLGMLVPSAKPPADLRDRFLSSLEPEAPAAAKPEPVRMVTPRWMRFALVAAAVLVVALLGWNIILSLNLSHTQAQLAAAQQPRQGIPLVAGASQAIPLVPKSSDATGMLYVSPDSNYGVLIVEKLPQAQPGMVYQIWLIQGSTPAPGTVFHVGDAGKMMVMIDAPEPLTSYQALAITQEPGPSGSTTPTGKMVVDTPLS